MLERARFLMAHVGKEGRSTHFMQIETWHKQPRDLQKSISSIRAFEGKFIYAKRWLTPVSSLCCSKVSSCNLIPLCSCTTRHADSTPLTSRHGLLIVARLRGTSSKDEERATGGGGVRGGGGNVTF